MEEQDPNTENIEGGEQNPEGEEGQNDEQGEGLNVDNEGEGIEGLMDNESKGGEGGEGGDDAEGEGGNNEEGEEVEDEENEEGQEVDDSQEIAVSQEGSQQGERKDHDSENKENASHNVSNSSKGFNDQSNLGSQEHEHLEGEDLGESNEDDGEDEGLPPERKIRYRLFKFINKMRAECHINPYNIDLIANNLAMLYADYLLTNKESEEELSKMANALNFKGEYKVSSLDSFIDSDGGKPDTTAMAKYMEFADDFYDVQATLIEFEEHCENILSENYNKVGIGMALNDLKVEIL